MFSSKMQAIEDVHVNDDDVGDVEMDSMNKARKAKTTRIHGHELAHACACVGDHGDRVDAQDSERYGYRSILLYYRYVLLRCTRT